MLRSGVRNTRTLRTGGTEEGADEINGGLLVPPKASDNAAAVREWRQGNPDNASDPLPEPYGSINEILEDIFTTVDNQIDVTLSRKKSSEYESGLPTFYATRTEQIPGYVTCASGEAPGTSRLVVGTSLGEVMVIETRSNRSGGARGSKQVFTGGEAVKSVTLSSDGSFRTSRPVGLDDEEYEAALPGGVPKKGLKCIVTGTSTPKILVYDVAKEVYGYGLRGSCSVDVPAAVKDETGACRPPVEDLQVAGTTGAIWVLALLSSSRMVHAYLVPITGTETNYSSGTDGQLLGGIHEDAEDEGAETQDEFSAGVKITTPIYTFALPSLAPLGRLPEPPCADVRLSLALPRPPGGSRSIGQVPGYCFVSAPVSNVVVAYCLRSPDAPCACEDASIASDLDKLLVQAAPPLGEVKSPNASQEIYPHHRWVLPSRTTAVAVSPGGGLLAVGGEYGGVTLIATSAGPGIRTVLPGHYASVTALAFQGLETLVSVGTDGWVHHYSLKDNSIRFRHLCSPPPIPPSCAGIAATQATPMAMALDTKGNLRILDLQQGQKLVRATCLTDEVVSPEGKVGGAPTAREGECIQLIATSSSFCVLCVMDGTAAVAGAVDAAEGEPVNQRASDATQADGEVSTLYLFDATQVPGCPTPKLTAAVLPTGTMSTGGLMGATGTQRTLSPSATQEGRLPSMPSSPSKQIPHSRSPSKATSTPARKLVELTEENLKLIGKVGVDQQAAAAAAQMVPDGWQAIVKKTYRSSRIDKNVRQTRLTKRLDLIRKEMQV
jgi:hypothetical protein